MGSEKSDDFRSREACVSKAGKDCCHTVSGLGDRQVGRWRKRRGTTKREFEAGSTRTVARTDRSSQMYTDGKKIRIRAER